SQFETGDGAAVLAGQRIPAGSAGDVLGDAQPMRIDFGDEGLGGGVVLFGARQRQAKGGEIIATLVGAVGGVDRQARAEDFLADRLGVLALRQGGGGRHQKRSGDKGGGGAV